MNEKNDLETPLSQKQEMQDLSFQPINSKLLNNNIDVHSKVLTPYYHSNCLSRFFFNWTRYAMKLANLNPLKVINFKGVSSNDQSKNLLTPLYEKWYNGKDPNYVISEDEFYYTILKTYWVKI